MTHTNTTPVIAPLHLKSAQVIATAFGVHRDKVRLWKRSGAPILRIGGKDQADYHALWAWLLSTQASSQGAAQRP